jgi:flagellar hook-associated protein 2
VGAGRQGSAHRRSSSHWATDKEVTMSGSIISGLGAGIDLNAIVTQLMGAERAPITKMNTLRLSAMSAQTAWGDIASKLSALTTAAKALDTLAAAQGASATSSSTTTLTASAAPGAIPGSTPITVTKLATAQQLSTGALTGPGFLVGAGEVIVSAGLGALGGSGLAVTAGTATGTHTVTVTQSSAGATASGSAAPALSYAPGGDDLTVTLADGVPHTVTLAASYADNAALLTDLNTQLSGVASFQLVAGQLHVSSRDEGSAATLTLAGGALTGLALTGGTTTGTDAMVSVEGGTPVAVSHVDTGSTVSLANGVSFTTGTHLTQGTASFTLLRTTGTTTLADLTTSLNGSGSPVSASLINTGDGTAAPYRLVLTAKGAGTQGAMTISGTGINVLDASQLSTVTAAADAQLSVGGATVTRSSNTVNDLLPGVTLTLVKEGAATVTVGTDPAGTSTKVQAFVDALNNLLTSVSTQTAYNTSTKKGGPLSGDSLARGISSQLLNDALGTTGTGLTKVLSQLGIETTRNGTLTFNTTTFAAAMQRDPEGVAGLVSSFAKKVEDFAKAATSSTGSVTAAGKSAGEEARRRQDQIDAFEVRMTLLEKHYRAKFSALDAALGSLKSQQAAMNAAISGLGSF